MAWTPQERRRFLQGLGDVERGLSVFYQYLLYGLLVAVTVFAFYLHRQFVHDAFHDFLDMFLGVLYLLFLLWAVGTLFALRRRISSARQPDTPVPPGSNFEIRFGRDQETGAAGFSFRMGATPPPGSSPKTLHWGISLSSVADEDKLDDEALARAAAHRGEGRSLEEICQLLNLRYGSWSSEEQQAYRAYLKSMLESREGSIGTRSTAQEPVPPAESPPTPSSRPPLDQEAPGFIPGLRLTPGQVSVFVIVLGILMGALFSVLWLSRAVK